MALFHCLIISAMSVVAMSNELTVFVGAYCSNFPPHSLFGITNLQVFVYRSLARAIVSGTTLPYVKHPWYLDYSWYTVQSRSLGYGCHFWYTREVTKINVIPEFRAAGRFSPRSHITRCLFLPRHQLMQIPVELTRVVGGFPSRSHPSSFFRDDDQQIPAATLVVDVRMPPFVQFVKLTWFTLYRWLPLSLYRAWAPQLLAIWFISLPLTSTSLQWCRLYAERLWNVSTLCLQKCEDFICLVWSSGSDSEARLQKAKSCLGLWCVTLVFFQYLRPLMVYIIVSQTLW